MSVYGEFLGEPWLSQKGMTRLSQIKNILEESDHASFLDLSPSLIREKDNEPLYFKSDTHWTEYGAYLGYLSIADKIESMFDGSRFKREFTFSETMTRICEKMGESCGDLTNMSLDYDSFSESFKVANEFSSCTDAQDYDYRLSGVDLNTPDPYIAKTCSTGTLKALVFRDSFFEAVEPYLSENFKEIIYLWKDYDPQNVEELISTFKPDIVIEETGERTL
jgi:alginate O-acetyltransferase complex protein AlgJ